MIAKLTGIIDLISDGFFILDVNGVGYQVHASSNTLRRLGDKGSSASILIHTHVREDHIRLYGFADAEEQEWFQILCKVQGVGTKVALAILSASTPQNLVMGLAAGDKSVVQQADGVGPKLAARLVTELKEKAGKMAFSSHAPTASSVNASGSDVPTNNQAARDAVSALVNLGYGQQDAFQTVHGLIANDENASDDVSALIRDSLKALSK